VKIPEWNGKNAEDVLELKIPSHGLMIGLISSRISCPSVVSILQEDELKHLISSSSDFEFWIHSSQILETQPIFRIFGNPLLFDLLINQLKSRHLKEGKHLALSESQPCIVQFLPKEGRVRVLKTSLEQKRTRVLVVDDSNTIRTLLSRMISADPQMECVATVDSPGHVMESIEKYQPDVITLDIHMPEMDGVTLLKKILSKYSIPIIMISAISKEEGTFVLDALELGAVDYIQKPSLSEVEGSGSFICEKIKNARFARVNRPTELVRNSPLPTLSEQNIDFSYLIAIGSSTGGTDALKKILTRMPENIPPIVIVQHIPPVFSKTFAERMNQLCSFEVKEAEDGDVVEKNKVFVAPGGKQMRVREVGGHLKIIIDDSPPVNRHKPSVDVLFDSIAEIKNKRVTAAILTGMGADGARGLLKLRQNGAKTLAQDEQSSVVFGMPKEALKLGGAQKAVPLDQIAAHLLNACKRSTSAKLKIS